MCTWFVSSRIWSPGFNKKFQATLSPIAAGRTAAATVALAEAFAASEAATAPDAKPIAGDGAAAGAEIEVADSADIASGTNVGARPKVSVRNSVTSIIRRWRRESVGCADGG